MEELRRIAREQQDFNRIQQEQLQQANANVIALTAALQQLTAGGAQAQHAPNSAPKKKPDLPNFDKKNVDVWIKRVEATYLLSNISEPRDKFAYLQSKFDVSFNPRINTFLYGDATAEAWEAFVDYLREEYGPTIRQRAQRYINDFPRNGLRPSQHLALLQEETKDVTIDDVQKEIVLRGVPAHIRQIMGKSVEQLSANEVAEQADAFFDREGRLLEKSPPASVNRITEQPPRAAAPSPSEPPPFTSSFSETSEDVNAVNRGGHDRTKRQPQQPQQPQQQRFSGPSSGYPRGAPATPAGPAPANAPSDKLCMFHRHFKEKATRCVSDCPKHTAFLAAQRNQGNASGGRRM